MTHGNGPAVDVDPVVVDVQSVHETQHDRRERLVELIQVDVVGMHAGPLQGLLRRGLGAGQHDRRLAANGRERADPGSRLEAQVLAHGMAAHEDGCSTVHDAAGVPGRMHMLNLLDLRIALQGHRIEAALLSVHDEGGFQGAQVPGRGAGTHMLVAVQQNPAQVVLDRQNGSGEITLVPGVRGPPLALCGVVVQVGAGQPVNRGDQVRADALGHEVGLIGHTGIRRHGAAVGAHRDTGHALYAAADGQFALAGHYEGRRRVDGFQARSAEPVDLLAGDGLRIACGDGAHPGDVGALLADRRDAAENDILYPRRVQVVSVTEASQDL